MRHDLWRYGTMSILLWCWVISTLPVKGEESLDNFNQKNERQPCWVGHPVTIRYNVWQISQRGYILRITNQARRKSSRVGSTIRQRLPWPGRLTEEVVGSAALPPIASSEQWTAVHVKHGRWCNSSSQHLFIFFHYEIISSSCSLQAWNPWSLDD